MNQPPKSCGTCQHAAPREVSEGAVSQIQCVHPVVVKLIATTLTVPDWIERGGEFAPFSHGQHCDAWEIVADK